MDRDVKERWHLMKTSEQISNIGSEIHRAIRFKNKNDEKKMMNFLNVALTLLDFTMDDPKNKNRIGELSNSKAELLDFFVGENIYDTTDDIILSYFDAFI